jgi:hypothetical protein
LVITATKSVLPAQAGNCVQLWKATLSLRIALAVTRSLSGHGDDGDFGRLSGVTQASIEDIEARIGAGGCNGGHVEGIADTLSAALDSAHAACRLNLLDVPIYQNSNHRFCRPENLRLSGRSAAPLPR